MGWVHIDVAVPSPVEVSEYLVGSPAFKAGGTGDPRPAGSIPVHLRQSQKAEARWVVSSRQLVDPGLRCRCSDDEAWTWPWPLSGGCAPESG